MKVNALIAELKALEAQVGNVEVIIFQPADYECIVPVRSLTVKDYGTGMGGGYINKPSKYTKKAILIT